ncbi:hypothetical protein H5A34_21075 [Pectobacterium brasiliense]|uniref:HEPN/Toprim-associated domain-containing protein n=1 Tax=Pectobacterium brasiliense TaxID=180957 RepID=UPI001968BE85|nr:HEPN/Toprim-associated domain-containing protein [Pectobacterium brasiliense]MBN3070511.1 hypothetical protein [Pectobacterium brasiliense]MBN3248615.1 hypothetical protein [Pectobacterium brasiliense]
MSSCAYLRIGEVTIDSWQNTYSQGYFKDTERVREIHEPHYPLDYEHYNESDFIGYRTTAAQLRRRMALQGYDRISLERHFSESLSLLIDSIQAALLLYEPNGGDELSRYLLARASEVLPYSTLDDWLSRIPRAISLSEGMDFEGYFKNKDYPIEGDPLLSVMLSPLPFFSDYSITAKWRFPCTDSDFFTIALLETCDDDTFCELDITELVYGERADDFTDLEELQQGTTSPFRNFRKSLEDISGLSSLRTDDVVLQRMCFSSIITAMEAYLSDIMKREILGHDAIKRRFVEVFSDFKKEKVKISDIYQFFDGIDKRIIEELDKISFHNLTNIKGMFCEVLLINFPTNITSELIRSVQLRHDIVHRNGKTNTGQPHLVTNENVTKLMDNVLKFVQDVDQQVIDGFLTTDWDD